MSTINKFRIFFFSVMTMMGMSAWGQGTGLSLVPNELSFEANEKTEERKATVVITNGDYENQYKSFTIAQYPEDIIFTVSTSSISFENVGGENNFKVTSNVDLELVAVDDGTNGVPSWFRLDKTQFQSPDANGNTESFKVTVDKNRVLKGRSGRISIRYDGTEMGIVSVEQDGSFASVTVSAASFNFEAESNSKRDSKTLVVTCNVPVTIGIISGGSDWLAVSPSAITHDDATVSTEKNFTLSVMSDNTSGKVREAKFNVIWEDENDKLQTKEIIVVQHSHYLCVSTSTLHYEPSGGSMTVNVTSDIDWNVESVGGGDWLSVTPFRGKNDGVLTVTAKKNSNLSPREARITVSGNGLTQDIEVYQEGNGYLTVDCTRLSHNTAGGTMSFNICSNIEWSIDVEYVEGGTDWLTIFPQSGSGNEKITITVSPNADNEPRCAILTVSGCGLSQVVVCANYDMGISSVTNGENVNNIYNVLGQKVDKSSIDRLPIGIYVINGVKVLKSNK